MEFIKKHPIIILFFLILIILELSFTLQESFVLWNKHPKKLICSQETKKCSLKTYSYEHKICWDRFLISIFSRKHDTNFKTCDLPKYKSDETEIMSLDAIKKVETRTVGRNYNLYLISNDNIENMIFSSESGFYITKYAEEIKTKINNYNNPANVIDEFSHLNSDKLSTTIIVDMY